MALEIWNEGTPASWITDSLTTFGGNVASLVPCRFEAYARLFHPALRTRDQHQVPVRWDEVARASGRVPHPEMQWANISESANATDTENQASWHQEPEIGRMPKELARGLAQVLGSFTSTAGWIWFCVWEGWGDLRVRSSHTAPLSTHPTRRPPPRDARTRSPSPVVNLPHRRYYLFRGQLTDVEESSDIEESFWADSWISPSMWWPDDRSWFVSTEIDLPSSYLGGTSDCVASVLAAANIEAMRAQCSDRIGYEADSVNLLRNSHPE